MNTIDKIKHIKLSRLNEFEREIIPIIINCEEYIYNKNTFKVTYNIKSLNCFFNTGIFPDNYYVNDIYEFEDFNYIYYVLNNEIMFMYNIYTNVLMYSQYFTDLIIDSFIGKNVNNLELLIRKDYYIRYLEFLLEKHYKNISHITSFYLNNNNLMNELIKK